MKLIDDLSLLTGLSTNCLDKLNEIKRDVIAHNLFEQLDSDNIILETDLGYISIYHDSEVIKYKFTPSSQFEKEIEEVIRTRKSPILKNCKININSAIVNTYKEMF